MAKPKRRTEQEAVAFLESRGAEIIGNTIKLDGCLGGLTGGSCLDCLVNYHGYKVVRGVEKGTLIQRVKKFFGR